MLSRALALVIVCFCVEAHAATLDITGGALTFTLGNNESGGVSGTGNSLTFTASATITRTGGGAEFPGGGTSSAGDFVVAGLTSISIEGAGGAGSETFTFGSTTNMPALSTVATVNVVELNGSLRTSGGAITLSSLAITITQNALIDTTGNGAFPSGAHVSVTASINGPSNGTNYTLAINAGTSGDVALRNVGNSFAPQSLTIDCADLTLQGQIRTAGGDIDFTGVTQSITTLTAMGFYTDETGGVGAGGNILFGAAPLDTLVGGFGYNLFLDTRADGGGASGDVTLGGIGASTGPTDLTVYAKDITLAAAITTSGEQRYTSDTITIGGALSTTTPGLTLTLQPTNAATPILLGDPGAAGYHLSAAEVAFLASTAAPWNEIIIGALGNSGDITIAASGVSFPQSTTLLTNAPAGDITCSGTVVSNAALTFRAGNTITVAGINAPTGSVSLEASNGGVTQIAATALTVQNLLIVGGGDVMLANTNNVGVLAASIDGAFTFEQATGLPLVIGVVRGYVGVTANDALAINVSGGGPIAVSEDVGSAGGTVTIVGRGNSTTGVGLDVSAKITSIGSSVYGPLVITGNGGTSAGDNTGVLMRGATIATANVVTITGVGGTNSAGIVLDALAAMGTTVSSNLGALVLSATPSIVIPSATVETTTGALTLEADEIDLGAASLIDGSGALTLQPLSTNVAVELGGAAATSALNLSGTELARLSDGFSSITFGRAVSSVDLTITADTQLTDPVVLRANGVIAINAVLSGLGNTTYTFNAGEVRLAGSVTLSGQTLTIDPDTVLIGDSTISATSVRFMGDLDLATHALTVNGGLRLGTALRTTITSATSYGTIDLIGTLNLSDAPALTPSLGYTPATTDRFTLITNDASDAVGGTFAGLAELATIPTTSLKITYKIFTNDVQLLQPATPTAIQLSETSLAEAQPVGTAIGVLTTVDADVGDIHTYTLVSGVGATDNGVFVIMGNTLYSGAVYTFATRSLYSVRIRSTDLFGLTTEAPFTITIDNPAGNQAPVFTNDPPIVASTRTPVVGEVVTFTAAATDIDNDALSTAWSYGDGAADATGSHGFATAGTFDVTVTVSDGAHTITSTIVLTVAGAGPTGPSAAVDTTDPSAEDAPKETTKRGCQNTESSLATVLLLLVFVWRRRQF